MRLKHPEDEHEPPSCFVKMIVPALKGAVGDQSFETDVCKESCYPTWYSRDHRVIIPLNNENMDALTSGERQLEFQVYHARQIGLERKSTLIGTAYADISALAIDTASESNFVSGYYHVYKKQSDSIHGAKYSVGQVKITIRAENNLGDLKRLSMQEGKIPTLSSSPIRKPAKTYINRREETSLDFSLAENPFIKDATFGEGLKNKRFQEHELLRESRHLRESQDSIRVHSIERDRTNFLIDRELDLKTREQLLETHQRNMNDLDNLFQNLQMSLYGNGTGFGIDRNDDHADPFTKVPALDQTQKTDT